jgi:16S rRNA processing protein RimM
MSKNLVLLGKVAKPHGLKGELRVYAGPGSPLLLEGVDRIYLEKAQMNPRPFRLLDLRSTGKGFLLTLEGMEGRDQAEKWRGAEVLAREKDVLKEREISPLLLLVGCGVYAEEVGYLGVLEDAWSTGAGVVWSIVNKTGREILFPAEDRFIKEIDRENSRIEINPPPGLLEIYT